MDNVLNISKINRAKQYALYISLASVFMMFSALISAYVVRQAAGNWLEFPLPLEFYISTGIIVLCSIFLHFARRSFIQSKIITYKILLSLAFVLGISFLIVQYQGWLSMTENGIMLDGNPSGSFVYVMSGLHAAHVLGGIFALILAIMQAWAFGEHRTEKRMVRLNLTVRYWHFVDILWLYLLLFLILTR